MGNISKHFSRYEFECGCGCGFSTADYLLITVLEDLREHFDKPITINSGCRCISYNEEVQHKYNPRYKSFSSVSQHLFGMAADIVVEGVHADAVADYLEEKYEGQYGIGRYNGRTHIDVRAIGPARWDKR